MIENPFEYHDSDLYVACVGDNGGTDDFDIREGFKTSVNILIEAVENGACEDTLVYPIVYNVRHSIELSLKIVIERLIFIHSIKNILFDQKDKKKIYTHNLQVLENIVVKYYGVDKRIVEIFDKVRPYLKDYYFDVKGDVFKYETDHEGNPHLITQGISSISYDVLKTTYSEMMKIFDELIFETAYLCKEYGTGTFTKSLSRKDIRNISYELPQRNEWKEDSFDVYKAEIKKKYNIGSKEFSDALNIIQKHREFCENIGMEILLGDIPEEQLKEYAKLVITMNDEENVSTGRRLSDGLLESLTVVQDKARRRNNFAKNISDDTLTCLFVFREFGNSMRIFSEEADRILEHFQKAKFDRMYMLKKVEKISVLKRILLGMDRCGQTTYYNVIEEVFRDSRKKLPVYEKTDWMKI